MSAPVKFNFTMEDAFEPKREARTGRTDEVPHIDAGSHFLRDNKKLREIPNAQTSPVQSIESRDSIRKIQT